MQTVPERPTTIGLRWRRSADYPGRHRGVASASLTTVRSFSIMAFKVSPSTSLSESGFGLHGEVAPRYGSGHLGGFAQIRGHALHRRTQHILIRKEFCIGAQIAVGDGIGYFAVPRRFAVMRCMARPSVSLFESGLISTLKSP